jgi:hypothetical protein
MHTKHKEKINKNLYRPVLNQMKSIYFARIKCLNSSAREREKKKNLAKREHGSDFILCSTDVNLAQDKVF